jgi:hypothetical protein
MDEPLEPELKTDQYSLPTEGTTGSLPFCDVSPSCPPYKTFICSLGTPILSNQAKLLSFLKQNTCHERKIFTTPETSWKYGENNFENRLIDMAAMSFPHKKCH